MKFSSSPVLSQPLPVWRSRLLQLTLLACFMALIGRSFYLQVFNNDFLKEKGEARYERVLEISATRGRILDRHGEVLSMSTPVKSIWAIPDDARLQPAQVRDLARMLELDVRELNRKLASDRGFIFIKRQISPDLASRVVQMKLPGIHQQQEYRRYYPGGEVTAHMLGFTSIDDKGQEGIELAMNSLLVGKSGSRRVIRDRRGDIVEDVESIKPPQDGRDITLALDSKIQYLAYTNLRQAVAEFRAKAGGIVVIDARTGEVLAMANLPTYNPNNRQGLVGAQLRNRALTDTFEPGSTMKPFTAALAMEQGKFHVNSMIDTAPGRMTIGNATIHDTKMHGTITVAQAIQKSSNVASAKMAQTLTPQAMWQMFDGLGFGSPLKLGFPGEVGGRLRSWKNWRPIEQATMAYGHGISVTLMQLARAYLVFARNGDLVPLSLTKADGPAPVGRQIFTAQTAHEVRSMLEMVVNEEGTAPKAFVPGYRAGGKTGTAHKIEGGVYAKKYVASFVGLAPVSDPRLVIAVMIDEPSTTIYYGGEVAAPVFSRVMAGALRALGVAQDGPQQMPQSNSVVAKEEM